MHVSGLTSDFGVANLQNYQARSSGGEHYPDTVGVMGSNPIVPTMKLNGVVRQSQSFFNARSRHFLLAFHGVISLEI